MGRRIDMKRVKLFAILFTLIFMAMGVFSGCAVEDASNGTDGPTPTPAETSDGTPDTTNDATPEPTEEVIPHETLENPDITIVYWMSMKSYESQVARDSNVYDPILDAVKPFEEKYGGSVTIKAVGWNDMLSTMTQMQNAGTAPDLVEVYDRTFHSVVLNNFVQPIDEYVTDADFSFYDISRDLVSWKGQTYAIPIKPYLYYIMFNRDMFEMEGLTAPDELFRQGLWDFDHFEEVSKALTRRVDGELVQYAFTSWSETIDAFIISNGGGIVKVDSAAGKVYSALSDPKTQNALTQISRWVDATNGFMVVSDIDYYSFDNNICAMIRGKDFPVDLPFEVGMVPIPSGPDAPPKTIYLYPQAFAIPVGAANPEGAAAFMYLVNQRQKEVGDQKEANRIGQENYDMIYAEDVNFVYSYDKGIDNFDYIHSSIINYMSDGMPAATIAETMESELQAAIEKVFGAQ
jgi:multiple sugar transport system substrate-binding protein